MTKYKCNQCGDEHTPENVCAYCTFCVDKIKKELEIRTENYDYQRQRADMAESERDKLAALNTEWGAKLHAAEEIFMFEIPAREWEMVKDLIYQHTAQSSPIVGLNNIISRLHVMGLALAAEKNRSDDWCAAWAEVMGEARFEEEHPDGMKAKFAALTNKLKEAESALSGRTISCSRCNDMAGKLEACFPLLRSIVNQCHDKCVCGGQHASVAKFLADSEDAIGWRD